MSHDDILKRLREATGGDREIDAALTEALATHPPLWKRKGTRAEWGNDHPLSSWDAPRYTASLDEAIGLVEKMLPGWSWYLSFMKMDDGPDWEAEVWPPSSRNFRAHSKATPALALLIALLEALNAQEPREA